MKKRYKIILFICVVCIAFSPLVYRLFGILRVLHTEFSVISQPYAFLFDLETELTPDSEVHEGVISMYNVKNNTFSAFGHPVFEGDNMPEEALVMALLGEKGGKLVGKVEKNTFFGSFGKFSKEYTPQEYAKMKVMFPRDIHEGEATLLMLNQENRLQEYTGTLSISDDELYALYFSVDAAAFEGADPGCSGSVILQDGKIAAIVCAGEQKENAMGLYAIEAYIIAKDML